MPTWRLSFGKDYLQYAMPDLSSLNESLKRNNSLMLLKLHPSMKYNEDDYEYLSNIIYVSPYMDVYPILPYTDVLITDYSSIYYDYLLMDDKGCIIYDFDYDNYIKHEYGFYYDFLSYTPGIHVNNYNELLALIQSNANCKVEKREWLLEQMWGDYHHKSNKLLVDEIRNR